ncbi:hypothetical protein I7I50_04985 [Histoplasma capsulatum G186AR]|uniref:Uncharacterized protein n=1 Tax=Ajellomyces capsulatus TaxID=5037 RepID=A0A8H7ZBM5_AJECA|nr:hypothetical protein I7I52_03243 [Histoplasma capsulatum]QSS75742.1 hypothetical protein I7I50_04985 [Histoplasma capsulatum G186AR]
MYYVCVLFTACTSERNKLSRRKLNQVPPPLMQSVTARQTRTLPPLKIKAEVLHTSGLSRQIRIESRASCRTEQRARVALPVLYLK